MIQFIISIFLLIISLGLYLFKTPKSNLFKGMYVSGIIISILFFVTYGIINYLTEAGITESAIYHLSFGIRYGLSQGGLLQHFNLFFISIISIIGSLTISILLYLKKPSRGFKKINYIFSGLIVLFLLLSLILNPVTQKIYSRTNLDPINPTIFGYVTPKEINETNLINFSQNSIFYKYYNVPEIKKISESKNLIFIYAESLERTFFDEEIFPGLTNNLREIESESISFTNIIEKDLKNILRYTMGGLVASHCGFPPATPSYGNSMSGLDSYLEGAICIGDLLKKEDYYLSYYGGADLNFAGKGNFFKSHSFNEIMGKHELLPKLKDSKYQNLWGLYDDTLFDLTYNRFIELSEEKDNFALFILTLDTHHPAGNPSASCKDLIYQDGQNEFLNAVYCSDHLISDFVKKIRQSEHSNNTVIVIASDHLAIRNTATDLLNKKERTNLLLINEPNKTNFQIDNLGTIVDITPTITPFIGYKTKMGLGRDLINRNETKQEILEIHQHFFQFKPYFLKFWNFPQIKNHIEINLEKNEVHIDERRIKYPVLIEINERLETVLKFKFNTPEEYGFGFHIKPGIAKFFFLVETCEEISKITGETDHEGLCLFTGNLNDFNVEKITSNILFTKEEIQEMVKSLGVNESV